MRWWRDNGLTIVLMGAFLLSIVGMAWTGWSTHNRDLVNHGGTGLTLTAYLQSGPFISTVFENWESEFLQMSTYVVLTAYLFQRGSAESRDPDGGQDEGERDASWRRRGVSAVTRFLYTYSLGIVLGVLFVLSFALHLYGSYEAANEEARRHGETALSWSARLASSGFWFESFQNWQSEFLSTALLVVLSIFLRYRGSPESKPVNARHGETGA